MTGDDLRDEALADAKFTRNSREAYARKDHGCFDFTRAHVSLQWVNLDPLA